MSTITRFTELSAAFRLTDAQLRAAISSDATTRTHARLLRRTAILLERIERFEPKTAQEFDELIDFFARRRVDSNLPCRMRRDQMEDIICRFDRNVLPDGAPPEMRLTPLPRPMPETVEAEYLARIISRATQRCAAISIDCRFLAVSVSEARSRRTSPSRIVGKHLFEVIGCGAEQMQEHSLIMQAFAAPSDGYRYRADSAGTPEDGLCISTSVIEDSAGRRYAVLRTIDDKR